MKFFITLLSVFITFFLIFNFGFAFGGIASLIIIGISIMLNDRIEYIQTLNEYSEIYENIYVVSNHPETNEVIQLPKRLEALIVASSYKNVHQCINIEKKWLESAKNPFFVDPNLTDEQRIRVIPIIYQDGQYINENWKQFKKRVVFEIKEDREKRHEMLKRTNEKWYHQHSNHQIGVSWKE